MFFKKKQPVEPQYITKDNKLVGVKMGEKEYRIAAYDLMMSNSPGQKSIYLFDKFGQRAGIAQALLNDPDLLILDEPFTGLDPLARIHFRELLGRLRTAGKTIFFSSHELGETELLCDTVAIMKQGRCIYHGPVSGIAGDGGGNLERLFLNVLEKGGVQ